MVCTNCGATLEKDSKFCAACGCKVEVQAPAAQPGTEQARPRQREQIEDIQPDFEKTTYSPRTPDPIFNAAPAKETVYTPTPEQMYTPAAESAQAYSTRMYDAVPEEPENTASFSVSEEEFDIPTEPEYIPEPMMYNPAPAAPMQAAPVKGTNGFCIAGFLIALFGMFNMQSSLAALILSIVGLAGRSKTGEKGKGFGIAGVILSALSIIVSAALAAVVYIVFLAVFDSYDLWQYFGM